MRFQKGQSGNPKGRKKPTPEELDFRARCRENTPKAMAAIEWMAQNSADESVRMKANCYLLDQGWGKAPQHVEISGNKERPLRAILEIVQKTPDGG